MLKSSEGTAAILLLLHVSFRCARMSVTRVKIFVRIFIREVSLYRVVTCLCTHCAWCVVLPLVLRCLRVAILAETFSDFKNL
jgi:hypothetical protein